MLRWRSFLVPLLLVWVCHELVSWPSLTFYIHNIADTFPLGSGFIRDKSFFLFIIDSNGNRPEGEQTEILLHWENVDHLVG